MLMACSGSRKYFKAAERLEKQGLVNEAADYYLEALQRKPSNTEARIKLKEVGQKNVSSLASEFFREYNTQQLEASLETYEKLKAFTNKTSALNISLDYPKTYDDDYQKAVETYCQKNYNQVLIMMNQKRYSEALSYIARIDKYNTSYKNIRQLGTVAYCEPLYQSAINNLENKNYSAALSLLSNIKSKTENYKDSKDLLELATEQQSKSFILFQPNPSTNKNELDIESYLFDNFNQEAMKRFTTVKIINNSPFQQVHGNTDLSSSSNLDLIQAIRKATAADYFYVYDVSNYREFTSPVTKTPKQGFQQVQTRINDTTVITEYKAFDYNQIRVSRSFSYEFKYRLINAYTNQIVASQTQTIKSDDAVEYQEFIRRFSGNINTLYPYNPARTPVIQQLNPGPWRNLFSARNTLKTFEELKSNANQQAVNLFIGSGRNIK